MSSTIFRPMQDDRSLSPAKRTTARILVAFFALLPVSLQWFGWDRIFLSHHPLEQLAGVAVVAVGAFIFGIAASIHEANAETPE